MRRWTAKQARRSVANPLPTTLHDLCPPGAILVVAPHPDDESLGCGGLIARAADAGRQVVVAILTDGGASHPGSLRAPPERLARIRRREGREAVALLSAGAVRPAFFGAADGRLAEREPDALAWLGSLASGVAVGSVFVSWSADPHPDHQAAFRIARRFATRRAAAFRAYPVWGLILEDEADAGAAARAVGLDVGGVLDRKRSAIAAHRSQTTALVADAPDAFRLTPQDLARHLTPLEPMFLWE